MKKGDLSKFIERKPSAGGSFTRRSGKPAQHSLTLQNMIDEAVEDVRAKHYREQA
jgi:hypothetical protein